MDFSEAHVKAAALKKNLERVIKGKGGVIDLALTALISRGHLLIEDVPGVGKTTLAHALARSVDCTFHRIQFTSDLLPSDVLGVTVYNRARERFEFREGPIFANFVLADEINRATPKTQSALLEAMNDRQVSVDRTTYSLPEPFMLLATENPVEFAGTYPLPESQLDRFTLSLKMGYPDREHEKEIVLSAPSETTLSGLGAVVGIDDVLAMQQLASEVRVDDDLVNYILSIVEATRVHEEIKLGVSPRGTTTLYRAARAYAVVSGRDYVLPDDIKALAPAVFAHRIVPAGRGGADFDEARLLIEEILSKERVPI